jgi:glycine/D-amino acid oxidase-like deaminating enzyme
MNMKPSRVVILGGGIAGLSCALHLKLRLRARIQVTLYEKNLLGQEASTLNGQTLHSGAAYVFMHPEAARQCHRVSHTFASEFRPYLLSHCAWYLLPRQRQADFTKKCVEIGMRREDLHAVSPAKLEDFIRKEKLRDHIAIEVPERQLDMRMVIAALAQRCLDVGVEIHTGTAAVRILKSAAGLATGLETHVGDVIGFDHLVLAAGSGSAPLLESLSPTTVARLTSIRTMHLLAAHNGINQPIRGNLPGFPVMLPQQCASTSLGTTHIAAVSSFAAKQKKVTAGEAAVDTHQVREKLQVLADWFRADALDLDRVHQYQVDKTEFLRDATSTRDVLPHYGLLKDLRNLALLVPGKLEFAWLAAQEIATAITNEISVQSTHPGDIGKWPDAIRPSTLNLVFDPFEAFRAAMRNPCPR